MRNKWWEKTVPKYGSQLKIYKGALICFILPPYTISYGPSQNSIYIEQKWILNNSMEQFLSSIDAMFQYKRPTML